MQDCKYRPLSCSRLVQRPCSGAKILRHCLSVDNHSELDEPDYRDLRRLCERPLQRGARREP